MADMIDIWSDTSADMREQSIVSLICGIKTCFHLSQTDKLVRVCLYIVKLPSVKPYFMWVATLKSNSRQPRKIIFDRQSYFNQSRLNVAKVRGMGHRHLNPFHPLPFILNYFTLQSYRRSWSLSLKKTFLYNI